MTNLSISTSFKSNSIRARAIDQYFGERLHHSLMAIIEAFRESGEEIPNQLDAFLVSVPRSMHVPPAIFGIYHDLALSASRDDLESTRRHLWLLAQLLQRQVLPQRVLTLRDEDLGPGCADLYIRMVNNDADVEFFLEPVHSEAVSAMERLFSEAMSLIRLADPEMANEIDVFGKQIVLAKNKKETSSFGGAATFFLWGALLVNPLLCSNRISLAETLAHESGHALLFGLNNAEPLTLNPLAETYASPLREDPRPMEGIVHATYVLARMNVLMRGILERAVLRDDEKSLICEAIAKNHSCFLAGLSTVDRFAKFTDRGREIFYDCVS
jgi:HEXXH motif-containing protein